MVIFQFYMKERKSKNVISLFVTYMTKKTIFAHKSFKTSIKAWINSKKLHRVIQFNQKAWSKPYIDMNTKLRTDAKK